MASHKLRPMELVLLAVLALVLASGGAALRTQERLADRMVRLHVLANSDTPEDQALKLRVRDAVLERADSLLEEAQDRQEAEELLRRSLPELEELARGVIRAEGYSYSAAAELRQTEFPTKAYQGFSLPAGRYLALRVVIGRGGGQNWWCVVFPSLCTTAAEGPSETVLEETFSLEELRLITEEEPAYELRFRVVELWEALRQRLEGE